MAETDCDDHGCDSCGTLEPDEHCAHCTHSAMSACGWTKRMNPEEREITLTMTLPDVYLIRRALDAYKSAERRRGDLLTWLHTDFGEEP